MKPEQIPEDVYELFDEAGLPRPEPMWYVGRLSTRAFPSRRTQRRLDLQAKGARANEQLKVALAAARKQAPR